MGNINSGPKKGEFPLELYKSEKFLGKGGFGTVHRYRIKQPKNVDLVEKPEVVAVKLISLISEDEVTNIMLEREYSISKSLTHKNIVRLIGRRDIVRPDSPMVEVNLVMEHCQIDLKQLLEIRKKFSSNDAAIIVKQILKGLKYLHHKNIIHRDIKPGNVLCLTDQVNPTWNNISISELGIKLADFGLAKKFEDVRSSVSISMTPCGTHGYWAPEVQEAKENGFTADSHFSMDSYSVGILTFKLVTGNLPTNKECVMLDEVKEEIPQEFADKLYGDDKLVGFLQSTVAYHWCDRHSASKLLEHDYVKKAPDAMVLLMQSADKDLWQAANDGNVDLIKSALDSGAEVEFKKKEEVEITNSYGWISSYVNPTPLFVASARGHLRAVECLISHGSNVDSTEELYGRTSLMAAAFNGHQEVICVLLENGAGIDVQDNNCETALMYASSGGFPSCVRLLLQRGAKNAPVNFNSKWTAFSFAGNWNPRQREAVKTEFRWFGINE